MKNNKCRFLAVITLALISAASAFASNEKPEQPIGFQVNLSKPDEAYQISIFETSSTESRKKIEEAVEGKVQEGVQSNPELDLKLVSLRQADQDGNVETAAPESLISSQTWRQAFQERLWSLADWNSLFIVARFGLVAKITQLTVVKMAMGTPGLSWKSWLTAAVGGVMSAFLQWKNDPVMKMIGENGRLDRWLRRAPISRSILQKIDQKLLQKKPGLSSYLIDEFEGLAKILVLIEIPYGSILKAVMVGSGVDHPDSITAAVVNVIGTSLAAMYFQAPLEKAIASDRSVALSQNPRGAKWIKFASDLAVAAISAATVGLATADFLEWKYADMLLFVAGTGGVGYYVKRVISRYRPQPQAELCQQSLSTSN